MPFERILFIAIGVFTLFIGITKTFFDNRKAQRMIRLFGEVGTQILYIVLGIGLIIIAFTMF